MNANVTRIHSRGLQLRVLCLAIGIALTLPLSALAQDTQVAPEQTAKPQSDADTLQKPAADDQVALEQKATTQIVPESLKQPAQLSSSVEVGAHFVSDDSFRFGRYTGLNEQGLTPLLNLDLFYRGAYDSGSARYWSFKGANLGLDSREAAFEYGVQGSYKLLLDYDQIPYFRSDSTRTIFDGAGSNNLTLPANWVGGGNTAGMTQVLPSLKSFNLKTERQRTGVGFSGVLSPQWDFSTSYKHETKDGNKSIGGVFGNSGGNPRAVILPEPVDYTTQQIDAALRFKSKKLQVQVAYYLSVFSDQNDSLFWSNPYTTITGWAAGAGFPAGRGQLSLPPDNKFHQLSVNACYNISDSTRVSASVARGRMTQNEPFLPYIVTGVLSDRGHVRVARLSTTDFSAVTLSDTLDHPFSVRRDAIGYDWKTYSFVSSSYTVDASIVYIVEDAEGYFHKLRFLDFYSDQGVVGCPLFEVVPL